MYINGSDTHTHTHTHTHTSQDGRLTFLVVGVVSRTHAAVRGDRHVADATLGRTQVRRAVVREVVLQPWQPYCRQKVNMKELHKMMIFDDWTTFRPCTKPLRTRAHPHTLACTYTNLTLAHTHLFSLTHAHTSLLSLSHSHTYTGFHTFSPLTLAA